MAPRPERSSPKVAGWLSVFPGLGLLYLGEYLKALMVVLIFAGVCQLADHSEFGGLLVPMVWFGQLFYAVKEARRRNEAPQADVEASGAPSAGTRTDSPLWGGILVGLGTFLLLDQLGIMDFSSILEKFWPALIIVLGIQILLRARRESSRSMVS